MMEFLFLFGLFDFSDKSGTLFSGFVFYVGSRRRGDAAAPKPYNGRSFLTKRKEPAA